ncbi:MAG: hypothetical protein SNJ82_05035, partial [Gemmataceae bacterium]
MPLTPRELELLTAYVDGTLSRSDYRLVKRLVRAKSSARRLLRSLLHDSRELQRLPAVPAPVDFSAVVLAKLPPRVPAGTARSGGTGRQVPVQLPRRVSVPTVGWFWGYATAVAVFLIVGGTSFVLHRSGPVPAPMPLAARPEDKNDKTLAKETHEAPAPEQTAPREPVPIVRDTPNLPRWPDFPPTVKVIPDDEPEELHEPLPQPLPLPTETPRTPVLASPQQ